MTFVQFFWSVFASFLLWVVVQPKCVVLSASTHMEGCCKLWSNVQAVMDH